MKNYKRITYILIIIGLGVFVTTEYFKKTAARNYVELDTLLSSIKFIENRNEIAEKIQEKCIAFTYFDEETYNKMEEILIILGSKDSSFEEIEGKTVDFQKLLHFRQQELLFGYDNILYCSIFFVLIAIIVIINDSYADKHKFNLIQSLNDAQIKFSRDLHDGVAQDLAALKVYIQKSDIDKAEFYAEHALNEVRYLIDSMHRDFSKSLIETFQETIKIFENNYKIKTHLLIASENLNKIKTEKQMELLRILQEALSNIARHANASEVIIQIAEVADDLKFNIRDNGIGFDNKISDITDSDNESDTNVNRRHYGVKNIKDRVANLGGTVEFITREGTTIAITIKNFIH